MKHLSKNYCWKVEKNVKNERTENIEEKIIFYVKRDSTDAFVDITCIFYEENVLLKVI